MDAPIRVARSQSDVFIEFNLAFTGKYAALPFSGSVYTYAEAAALGIATHWGGGRVYDLAGVGGQVRAAADPVRVRAVVTGPTPSPSGVIQKPRDARPAAEVRMEDRHGGMTEHVFTALNGPLDVFRLPCNLIDALQSGQLERVLYNWTPRNPGTAHLYPCATLREQMDAAAHEAGHLLGLGDAYGSGLYRLGEACPAQVKDTNFAGQPVLYPVPEDDMMRTCARVSAYDIVLALKAAAAGRPQFFPKGDDFVTRDIQRRGLGAVIGYIREGKIKLG